MMLIGPTTVMTEGDLLELAISDKQSKHTLLTTEERIILFTRIGISIASTFDPQKLDIMRHVFYACITKDTIEP